MASLKEMLLQEQNKLEDILQKTKAQLQDAPAGKLRLSRSGESIQYYHCMPDGKINGKYIPKEKEDLIRRLAQKDYDEKVLKLAAKRLKQIQKITADYRDEEIDQIFQAAHSERQKLIRPVMPTWEQQVKKWISQDYTGKEFAEGVPVIRADHGERVRSKSEKILADYFYRRGIPYKYECPLYLKGLGLVYPDFTFLSRKTGTEIYWEHAGRMDDPVYAENAVRKIQLYEANGIYPGERLILTFETSRMVLDTKLIEMLADRYLR